MAIVRERVESYVDVVIGLEIGLAWRGTEPINTLRADPFFDKNFQHTLARPTWRTQ